MATRKTKIECASCGRSVLIENGNAGHIAVRSNMEPISDASNGLVFRWLCRETCVPKLRHLLAQVAEMLPGLSHNALHFGGHWPDRISDLAIKCRPAGE